MKVQKLNNIINHYKYWKSENPDTWIEHCINQTELEKVIIYAALAENHLGKRHSHQRRLKKINLQKFAANLVDKIKLIESVKSFDALMKIVDCQKNKGIGKLTCYDTTLRIGAYLRLEPIFIYLHSGTKIGAEKLLGKKLPNGNLQKKDLPSPFQRADITTAEIEDILCIYKKRF